MKPEHRKAMAEAMATTIAFQRKLAIESEAKALAELRAKMTYTETSPAVREEMRKLTAPVIDEVVRKRAGSALVDQVLAEVAKR